MKDKKIPGWLVLAIISCVAAILLASTNLLTSGVIKEHEAAAAMEAYRTLIPDATAFKSVGTEEKVIYQAVKDNDVIGYTGSAISDGFGGEIEVTVGVDQNGKLTGISVGGTNFAETAGLGAKAKEPEFTNQFKGLEYPVALSKNGGQVDAITGATITSNAVVKAVNEAFENFASEGYLTLDIPEEFVPGELADGTYQVTGQGMTSDYDVKVTIENGTIASVTVSETGGSDVYYLENCRNDAFLGQFVGMGYPVEGIDTVSGATTSSNGIIEAVTEALMIAGGMNEIPAAEEVEETVGALKDGTYQVTGQGMTSDYDVKVTIENGTIASVTVSETGGSDVYFLEYCRNDAFLGQFVGMGYPVEGIDMVSGATVSSNGILAAVNEALEEAAK